MIEDQQILFRYMGQRLSQEIRYKKHKWKSPFLIECDFVKLVVNILRFVAGSNFVSGLKEFSTGLSE